MSRKTIIRDGIVFFACLTAAAGAEGIAELILAAITMLL